MNWDFETNGGSDRVKVGILVTSDLFRRGLREILKNDLARSIQARILTSTTAIGEIQSGRLDALILDTGTAPWLAEVLEEHIGRPRIIMVSSRFHAGVRLPLPKNRICSFYSACSPERELHQFLDIVLGCHNETRSRGDCERCPIQHSLRPRALQLSERETEVFKRIGLQQRNSEIAEQLDISVKTVEAHSANIQRKLTLRNSRELVQKAGRWVDGF